MFASQIPKSKALSPLSPVYFHTFTNKHTSKFLLVYSFRVAKPHSSPSDEC